MAGNFLGKTFKVARIGNEYVLAALRHHCQAVPFQRKDVIEGQCRDGDDRFHAFVGVALPGNGLLNIENHVAMAEHRALRDARGTARILQVGDVRIAEVDILELVAGANLECAVESHAVGKAELRHGPFYVAQHEVGNDAAWKAQEVANAGCDDVINIRVGDDVCEDVREIFEYDHAARTRIA